VSTITDAGLRQDNRRLLVRLSIVAAAMFGFGFALVPFYDRLCVALGINVLGDKSELPASTQVDASRTVTVEFDANTRELPWRFRPLVNHVALHPGALTTVEFEIANVRERTVTGQAVPSFGPAYAAQYVRKIECFCFTPQTLAAGETRRMPVVFVVDPKLPADINTITLSYTFFEVPGAKGNS